MWILFYNPWTKFASNISNFVVAKTKLSFGMNLKPKVDQFSIGAGIVVSFFPGLEYDVKISIANCYFINNFTAHLYNYGGFQQLFCSGRRL